MQSQDISNQPENAEELSVGLGDLHLKRKDLKQKILRKLPLKKKESIKVLEKTGFKCHVCGQQKDEIAQYISANLSTLSIKTLTEHFSTNAPVLNEILKPYRPGSLIQQLRLKTLKKMRQEGNDLNEISRTNGFIVSYIKK